MREPKFKYWDGELKQMCDIRAIVWHNNMIANIEVFDSKTMCRNPNMFYEHALLEYTGLKDKNGKEIYEGDIYGYQEPWEKTPDMKPQGVVLWEKSGCWEPLYGINMSLIMVIGNIYENPELLKEAK